MLKLNESQSIYAYNRHAYEKKCLWVIYPQYFIGNNENSHFPPTYYILQLCPPRYIHLKSFV